MSITFHRGVGAALGAAALFGAGTPFAKLLLAHASPWLLAGVLYLGSGVGLLVWRLASRAPAARLQRAEAGWLAGAVIAGGMLGPLLLMTGLAGMEAADVSLLLNAESVLTALIAWFAFKENFDRRIAWGMIAIAAGAMVLGWPSEARAGALWPSLAVLGACLAWALDNNLTRKVSVTDASFIAMTKGLVAGATNLALFGAVVAIGLLGEPFTLQLALAGVLMAIGLWLHLTESHGHLHVHEPMEHAHEHEHEHDEHHQHAHADDTAAAAKHAHWHRHDPVAHTHSHYPDVHHRHTH